MQDGGERIGAGRRLLLDRHSHETLAVRSWRPHSLRSRATAEYDSVLTVERSDHTETAKRTSASPGAARSHDSSDDRLVPALFPAPDRLTPNRHLLPFHS